MCLHLRCRQIFPCLLHKDGADIRRTTWNPGNIEFPTSRSYHQKQRGKVSSFHKFWSTSFIFICLFFPSPFSLSLINTRNKPQLQNTKCFFKKSICIPYKHWFFFIFYFLNKAWDQTLYWQYPFKVWAEVNSSILSTCFHWNYWP